MEMEMVVFLGAPEFCLSDSECYYFTSATSGTIDY